MTLKKFNAAKRKERKLALQPYMAARNENYNGTPNTPTHRLVKRFEGTALSAFMSKKVAELRATNSVQSPIRFKWELLYCKLKRRDFNIGPKDRKKKRKKDQQDRARKRRSFDLSLLGFDC